jgi:hypothetical protein
MEAEWLALFGFTSSVIENTLKITTMENITELEERLTFLARAERADLAILRSRPYTRFRNAVIMHIEQPGTSTLKVGDSVRFWNIGICINVIEMENGVTVWTGINECDVE